MKLSYTNWNRDYVSDETIMDEFEMLSNGRLRIPNNADLDSLSNPPRRSNNNYRGSRSNRGGKKYSRRRK